MRRQLVAMHVATEVQKVVSARCLGGVANGDLHPAYGSLLKLGNDILTQRRAELGLQLAGGQG